MTLIGIIPLKEDKCTKDKDGKVIQKSQIITDEAGSLFCFTSAIINATNSFAFGSKASLSLEEKSYKDKDGKDQTTINVLRCEFTTKDETFRTAGAYGVTVSAN